MRKKEKPEGKMMNTFELAEKSGYLSRVDQEKGIFGPLVEALKLRQRAYEDSPPGAMCKGEYLTIKQALEAFYKENPSWKK